MAITKIHAIKTTTNKVLDYISNPEKTDGQLLVSGYNCQVMTAFLDFKMTSALGKEIKGDYSKVGGANNQAYHLIQSFSPDDKLTPEQAHEIGKKLANEFLEGKFEYVISTHIDRGHIHNHVVINAVSFYDYKKLRTKPYKTAAKIRAISDRICSENDLSVIKEKRNLGYSYTEYKARKTNTSWKSEIRKRLNYILETSTTYEQFKAFAAEIGVEVNDTGKHIKYKLDGQERYTRGNKLADTDRFLREGVLEQISLNKRNISYVEMAIKNSATQLSDYDQFIQNMKEQHNITIKKERSGGLSYCLDNDEGCMVKERALNAAFQTEMIRQALQNKNYDFKPFITNESITELYSQTIRSQITVEETRLILNENQVAKVTVDGILLKVPNESGRVGKVFIDNKYINFSESSSRYEIYINPRNDFHYVNEIVNADILESQQLSSGFIKGENLIRQIDIDCGTKPVVVEIDAATIKSVGVKGICITLPDKGIDSLFIENQHITYDKLNNRCSVNFYENWTYHYRKDSEVDKNIHENIKGRAIIDLLKDRVVDEKSSLINKIKMLEKKIQINDTKALADTLLLLRRENILKVSDFDLKIEELQNQCKEIKETFKVIESKNEQYKEVAKYLIAYNQYLPIKLDYEKQSVLTKKKFQIKKESELLAFEHAVKQLEKLGVNTNVDPNKVIALIKQQNSQNADLHKELNKANDKLDAFKKARIIVEQIIKPKQEELKIEPGKSR